MKRLVVAGVSLLLLYLSVTSANAKSSVAWFQQRVNWQAGKEALPWEVAVASPDGKQHYRLALVPLWALHCRKPCQLDHVFNGAHEALWIAELRQWLPR
jgi:hypothetical protein